MTTAAHPSVATDSAGLDGAVYGAGWQARADLAHGLVTWHLDRRLEGRPPSHQLCILSNEALCTPLPVDAVSPLQVLRLAKHLQRQFPSATVAALVELVALDGASSSMVAFTAADQGAEATFAIGSWLRDAGAGELPIRCSSEYPAIADAAAALLGAPPGAFLPQSEALSPQQYAELTAALERDPDAIGLYLTQHVHSLN